MEVFIYDTTLRDGTQGEGFSLTLDDKIKGALALDELGVDYIEGGWPGSNPKDEEFFRRIRKEKIKAKLCSFGSTRRAGVRVESDSQVRKLVEAQMPVVTIYGKTWDLHVKQILKTTEDENLRMIEETLEFLKREGFEVIFDAEHFFDGYRLNPEYAIKCLKAAESADFVVLCDTNGGSLPWFISDTVKKIKEVLKVPLGIHTHNDMGLAIINSIEAVKSGAVQVQGTINGFGERCGNADLISIVPILALKMGCEISVELKRLKKSSDVFWELVNINPPKNQPFVGASAFAHKGGVHIDAVLKHSSSYEHIDPELVGNTRKTLISDLSGKSAMLSKLKELGFEADEEEARGLLNELKELEAKGYDFESAEASLELMALEKIKGRRRFFKLRGFRVIIEKRDDDTEPYSEATIKVEVEGKQEHTAAEGEGPVNALDNALRKALEKFYPELKEVVLKDFKVRVVQTGEGTASAVRVFVESGDGKRRWGTVGVSRNIIEASWKAIVDSIEYKLTKES